MKDLQAVDHVTDLHARRRSSRRRSAAMLEGSHDGRFWFRLASIPPQPPRGAGGRRVRPHDACASTRGNYTGFTTWQQVVDLSEERQADRAGRPRQLALERARRRTKTAKEPHAVIWHGKFVQPQAAACGSRRRAGTARPWWSTASWSCRWARRTRTVDVWLDRGTHDLTIFAATADASDGPIGARGPREDHNAAAGGLGAVPRRRLRSDAARRQAGPGPQVRRW